jgi:hypothetical protein
VVAPGVGAVLDCEGFEVGVCVVGVGVAGGVVVGVAVVVVGAAVVVAGALVVGAVGEAVFVGVGEAVVVVVGAGLVVGATPLLATVKFPRRREVVPFDHVSTTLMLWDPSASFVLS